MDLSDSKWMATGRLVTGRSHLVVRKFELFETEARSGLMEMRATVSGPSLIADTRSLFYDRTSII